ncbi:hypothetical protein D3C76_1395580 [compost metagenome]
MDIAANTPTQLLGGGLGKGHHQDLLYRQRPGKSRRLAQAKQQAQIQRPDGKGLAGPRRGFYQPFAKQRQR